MRRFAFVLLAAATFAMACSSGAPRSSVVSPSVQSVPNATLAGAGSCAGCHRREAEEWNASLHHQSFTDPDFQASFSAEPEKFCFDCHAPLAESRADAINAARGVGCPSCHSVADGHGERTFAVATKTCSSCHEFAFPNRTALMQSTMTEHAASAFSKVDCASCHFPRAADGHRQHRADVSRNAELLRAAIGIESRRTTDGVEVTLTTHNVGHAMPTGDLFRRLVVTAYAEDGAGKATGQEEIVVLARRFDRRSGVPVEVEDTRIVGERRIHLRGKWIEAAARIGIRVHYERVAQTADFRDARGELEHQDSIFARILLSETLLADR